MVGEEPELGLKAWLDVGLVEGAEEWA